MSRKFKSTSDEILTATKFGTATLRLVGGKIEYTQTKDSIGKEYPRKFTLRHNK